VETVLRIVNQTNITRGIEVIVAIPTGKIMIITVKVLSIILSILMLMFIFGDGLPEIGDMSPRETILLVCFTGMLVGLVLVWFKQKAAAWTILGASAAFWLVEVIYNSSFWIHWFFLLYPIAGVLLFLSEKYETIDFGKPAKERSRWK
jgi:hypothetical protein